MGEGVAAMRVLAVIFWGGLVWIFATGSQVAHVIDWISALLAWIAIYQTMVLWRGHLMINRIVASMDAQEALLRKVQNEKTEEH
jgi:hypothetical protein